MKKLLHSFCAFALILFVGCEKATVDQSIVADEELQVDEVIEMTINEAITRGNLEVVKELLSEHPVLANDGARPGMSPLLSAILRKKEDIARVLIAAGADVGAIDSSSRTAVHLAVERNLPLLIPLLAEKGAALNELDSVGWTPLHWAGAKDRIEAAKALIDSGADVHATSKLGGTALHEAASSGSKEMLQMLIDQGVDPNVVASEGKYALDIAIEFKNQNAIDLLTPLTRRK